ncbi:Uncharacterized protein APZ42_001830, partial [Daphnia magna]
LQNNGGTSNHHPEFRITGDSGKTCGRQTCMSRNTATHPHLYTHDRIHYVHHHLLHSCRLSR